MDQNAVISACTVNADGARNNNCEGLRLCCAGAMKSCPVCTLENEDAVLACAACGTELPGGQLVQCPACTYENPKMADRCEMCEAVLEAEVEWRCIACGQSEEELTAAAEEAEAEERIIWLPCAHRACMACHRRWIQAQDEKSKEPTCLACEASGGDVKPLDDACIREILGKKACMGAEVSIGGAQL